MTTPILITTRQSEYLQEFAAGPHPARHFVLAFSVSSDAANKMLKKLKGAGLIKATTPHHMIVRGVCYELVRGYDEMLADGSLKITRITKGTTTTSEETWYTIILRNGGLVGQRLERQFRKQYPNCKLRSMGGLVDRARATKLCR